MRYSPLVERIGAQDDGAGPEAWEIHIRALEAQARGEDVIVMSVGDPDFDTPPAIRDAAIAALQAGDTHYTPIPGKRRLREAVARDFATRQGVKVGPENVMITSGAQCALFCASLCVAGPGDEVVALEPMYVTYSASIQVSGAKIVRAHQPPETGFRPTRKAIEAAITPKTRALLIATPNNPTGVMLNEVELAVIAEIAQAHDLWVIADEVYARVGFDREHRSIAALPGMAERTVTLGGLSKSHAMTGWRVGWAIAPATMIEHLDNLGLCMLYGLAGFIQEGAITALTESAGAAERMRSAYRRRRDIFARTITRAPGLTCHTPEGGMFALVDVRATGLSAHDFADRLFTQTGVSVIPGDAFGPSASGFIRVSFALSEEKLAEACIRIARFARTL